MGAKGYPEKPADPFLTQGTPQTSACDGLLALVNVPGRQTRRLGTDFHGQWSTSAVTNHAVINHSSAGTVCFFRTQLFIAANNGVPGDRFSRGRAGLDR
jgi:hypothetical protein